MKLKLLYLCLAVLSLTTGFAQTPVWGRADGATITPGDKLERASSPTAYHLFTLNLAALKQQLQAAPMRLSGTTSNVVIAFPDGNGELKNFRIYEAPTMQPGLQAKHPDMRSYIGKGIDKPSETIRFSITLFGFHNMMFANETSYTDPYTKDHTYYMVYKKKDLGVGRSFYCGFEELNPDAAARTFGVNQPQTVQSTDGTFRVYRLAMSNTIEYAAYHINAAGLNNGTQAQKIAAVQAAMVVTMNRVNGIYERDFAVTMEFIDNNEDLIFIDADEYDNSNTDNALLGQSQTTIDAIIGFDKYDIGHTVSTGGGGVASFQSVCSGSKAAAITGLGAPVGDSYDIDFVAHEIGHQFGGNHSFNNECGGNRNNATAYETGSGTTIMAYAGVCDPNVEFHSDAQFHAQSIIEMSAFIAGNGNCSVNTVTGNVPPVVNAGKDHTIPFGTPFILSGSATDENGDDLTYCWEQMDKEISVQPPVNTSSQGPNFRSVPIKDVPQRFLPDIDDVLDNNLYPTWEVISNVARDFKFDFTVRDNNVLGGQVVIDDMVVHVSGTAGPFAVTSPNTNVSWQAGTNQTVTWNVAGTTANGVNTPYVDILLSTDGGYTYPTILGAKVPNDGSETVTIPNIQGTTNRIMVKGYDNIFYDLGNANFTITAPATTMAFAVNGAQNITACKGNDVAYTLAYNAYSGFNTATTFTITGNPVGSVVTFNPASISATGAVAVTISNTTGAATGFYTMTVTATSGSVTKTFHLYLDLLDSGFGPVTQLSPANGATAVPLVTTFDWEDTANAGLYQIEIATDAAFTNIVEQATVTESSYATNLGESFTYYWRVSPANEGCTGDASPIFSFTTGYTLCVDYISDDVPVLISPTDVSTVTSNVMVDDETPIESITVSMDITHTWVGDLTIKLISPQGTEVQLISQECAQGDNVQATFNDDGAVFNCGDNPSIGGIIIPDVPLSTFNGENPAGEWTLSVFDEFGEDGGALNSWSLQICATHEFVASVTDVKFNDFTVYPNPTNGDFTVRFNPATADEVSIMIYDIRGRQVLNRAFTAPGSVFEQTLSLSGAESGIYLVHVKQGATSVTKKIVVN